MTAAELKAQYTQLEDQVVALQKEKDDSLEAVWDEYRPQLQELQPQLRDAQKAYCDAEAAEGLVGHPDAESLAESLGLTLPE